jgi:hypothetical protein
MTGPAGFIVPPWLAQRNLGRRNLAAALRWKRVDKIKTLRPLPVFPWRQRLRFGKTGHFGHELGRATYRGPLLPMGAAAHEK